MNRVKTATTAICLTVGALAGCDLNPPNLSNNVIDTSIKATTPVASEPTAATLTLLALGNVHTCGLTADGLVLCWGENEDGQLGINSRKASATPVWVQGFESAGMPATFVAAGFSHSCAVRAGNVHCWGANAQGQLGDGTSERRLTPVQVAAIAPDIVSVAAGASHTCALSAMGTVQCWGDDRFGQLGDGPGTTPGPVTVTGLADVSDISAGATHTCALRNDQSLLCWGSNIAGQLGTGTFDQLDAPPATGPGNFLSVSAGTAHTCAIGLDKNVSCWGANDMGQLRDGTTQNAPMPVLVSGLPAGSAREVISAQSHSCALDFDSSVRCWGSNEQGQLGVEDLQQNKGFNPALQLSHDFGELTGVWSGGRHTCSNGSAGLSCWGEGRSGQLGDGSMTQVTNPGNRPLEQGANRFSPLGVFGLSSDIVAIAAAKTHTCALISGGTPLCWGSNATGQIGDGLMDDRLVPTLVSGLSGGIRDIATASYFVFSTRGHTCAVTRAGEVLCWGYNGDGMNNAGGQLGDGTNIDRPTPTPVVGLTAPATAVAVGVDTSCAALTNGTMMCWGGGVSPYRLPYTVTGVSNVIDVGVGDFHQCELLSSGEVNCQGNSCCLGNGGGPHSADPVAVLGIDDATSLSVGELASCAVTGADGNLKCWGFVGLGPIDNGSELASSPVVVPGLESGVTAVEVGDAHFCAIKAGDLFCWGSNGSGQLGDGTMMNQTVPMMVLGLDSDVLSVSAGEKHTCAVTVAGGLKCWGDNTNGQFGNNSMASSSSPVNIPFAANTAPTASYVTLPPHAEGTTGLQTVPVYATINPGPGMETAQKVSFGTIVVDPDGVLVANTTSLDDEGTLRYALTGKSGAAIVSVTPRDNGGTRGGGVDRGMAHEFRIFSGIGADLSMSTDSFCNGTSEDDFGEFCRFQPGGLLDFNLSADYRYNVTNEGPMAMTGARFRASFVASVQFKTAAAKGPGMMPLAWTCTTPSGACTPASGTGNVDATFDLAVGDSADIQLVGPLDPNMGFIAIKSEALLPEGIEGFLQQDNQSLFIRPVGSNGLFLSGFE